MSKNYWNTQTGSLLLDESGDVTLSGDMSLLPRLLQGFSKTIVFIFAKETLTTM